MKVIKSKTEKFKLFARSLQLDCPTDTLKHFKTSMFQSSSHAFSYREVRTCVYLLCRVQESESAGADSRVQVLETDRK